MNYYLCLFGLSVFTRAGHTAAAGIIYIFANFNYSFIVFKLLTRKENKLAMERPQKMPKVAKVSVE